VFLTAEDEFGLSLISEETYLSLYEAERLPVRSSAEMIAPRDTWLRLRVGETTPGNYGGL
jgi:hypothetical protein